MILQIWQGVEEVVAGVTAPMSLSLLVSRSRRVRVGEGVGAVAKEQESRSKIWCQGTQKENYE